MGRKTYQPSLAGKKRIMNGENEENEDQRSFGSSDGVSSASGIVNIDARGDLLLRVKHDDNSSQDYRVSVACLRELSAYFDVLLDPVKFSEGASVRTRLVELRSFADTTVLVAAEDLPRVIISDIGKAKKSKSAFKLFLEILHNREASIQTPGIHFISILALIADRFDATAAVSLYMQNRGWKKRLARPVFSTKPTTQIELIRRQKLFIGLTFGFQDWVNKYSSDLIYQGSEKWRSEFIEHDEETPWLYLPNGIEEELYHRRNCIFDTLGSIQSHFLSLYSRNFDQPECRLGYDSSWQCDIFQLGQMIRHLTRKGTLTMQSTYASFQDPPPHPDSIAEFLSILRQCPHYQVNATHSHCGPRAKLEPALQYLVSALSQTGICLRCWKQNQTEESWEKNPVGGKWYLGMPRLRKIFEQCHDHYTAKAVCTAKERDWTPLNVGMH